MRGNERGVSPVIATILLIALTVVAVGTIAAFLGLLSPGSPTVSVNISLEGWTSTSLTFFHRGGDSIEKSYLKLVRTDNDGNSYTLADPLSDLVGAGIWAAGESLSVTGLSGITENDKITLVYKPADQVILDQDLRTWTP